MYLTNLAADGEFLNRFLYRTPSRAWVGRGLQAVEKVGIALLMLMDNDVGNGNPEGTNADALKGLMTLQFPLTQALNPYKMLPDRMCATRS